MSSPHDTASDQPTEPVRRTAVAPVDGSVGARVLQRSLEERLFGSAEPVRLGRFAILERLGRGGMGVVYAAYDPDLDRKVAVKLLHSVGGRSDRSTRALLREAKALARLGHASVVTVHEVGVHEGRVFIAMEFAPGGTLAAWAGSLAGDPARTSKIVARMRECIAGLAAAHQAGLIHRDFKPANVLIGADERAKVADFGLARMHADPDAASSEAGPSSAEDASSAEPLTRSGQIVGTPAYMAPEQFEGRADARSDQFSLCVTFFELLFGQRPFPGSTSAEIVASIAGGVPERPTRRDVPDWVFALLCRGLSPDPSARFSSMRELGDALRRATQPRRSVLPLVGVLGMTATAVAVAWPRPEPALKAEVGSPCTDGRETLAPVWGPRRQAAIRAAFEATGQRGWPGLWERVQSRFDAWADAWSSAYLASCEATRVHRTQPEPMHELRRLCFARQAEEMRALSDEYLEVDAETVWETSKSSLALPPVADCNDRERMVFADGRADLTTPAVQRFYELYGRGTALARQRRDGPAEMDLREAAILAEDHDLPILAAQAQRPLATLLYSQGDHDEAERVARRGLHNAERAGDSEEIVWAWFRLAYVARESERWDDAAFYMQRALDNAEGFGVSGELRSELMGYEAFEQVRAGRPAAAARLYLEAAAMVQRLGLNPHLALSDLQDAIGPLSMAGEAEKAAEVSAQIAATMEELHGAGHPLTLMAMAQVAQVLAQAGNSAAALELTTSMAAHLPDSGIRPAHRLQLLGFHAHLLQAEGHPDEALALLKDTLAAATEHRGESSLSVILAREAYAAVLLEQGHLELALPEYEALAAAMRSRTDILPIRRGGTLLNHAETLSKLGRHEAAVQKADAALAILIEATGPTSTWRFDALYYGGETILRAGQARRARKMFGEALEIAKVAEVDPAHVLAIERHVAELDGRRLHHAR